MNWLRRYLNPEREYLYEPSRNHVDYGRDFTAAAKAPEYWTKRDGETLRGIRPEPSNWEQYQHETEHTEQHA